MKVLLICGSAQPGKDGVGDYTLALASALAAEHVQVRVIGVTDPHVDSIRAEAFEIRKQVVACQRIPQQTRESERWNCLRQTVSEYQPDWVSFQFVPWTYQPKGCVFRLGKHLAECLGPQPRLHVMMHELWIGDSPRDPWRQRSLGQLQRYSIRRFLEKAQPSVLTTSNAEFSRRLRQAGHPAEVLPVFGNIPISPHNRRAELLQLLQERSNGRLNAETRNQWLVGGVFGTVHRDWHPQAALMDCLDYAKRSNRSLALVFGGRNGVDSSAYTRELEKTVGHELKVWWLGEQSNEMLSAWFKELDFGLATTPYRLIGKSGSCAAMVEHGIPVAATRCEGSGELHAGGTREGDKVFPYTTNAFDWDRFLSQKTDPLEALPMITRQLLRLYQPHER